MRDFLSKRVVSLEPSGIRKFFDIVSEMKDAISLIGASQNLLYIECRVKGAAL